MKAYILLLEIYSGLGLNLLAIYFALPYCLSMTRIVYNNMEPKNTSPELPKVMCEVNNRENYARV